MATGHRKEPVNEIIEERANVALRHSPYLALKRVVCRCDGNTIILEGRVPSYYEKQQAQEAVAHLPEMPSIDNRIVVGVN